MKSFHAESENCGTDSISCATFDVTYPEFTQLDTAVQAIFYEQLTGIVTNGEVGAAQSIDEEGKNFVEDFAQMKSEMPELAMSWYFKSNSNILIASDTLISVQVNVDSFMGGAHGMYTTSFINIDSKNGAPYLSDRFLKPGYQEFLNKLGEEEFRKEQELADTTSLDQAGFNFPENRFQLNDNYGLRKEGIVFFYNSYEVGPYSLGSTEIIIPYEKLRGWFK
ncbi:MAG TPA: DUF3298 domain-containing protein [Cyclobacteriaceae bacterium]